MKNISVYMQDDQQNTKCACLILTSLVLKYPTFSLIDADIWESDIISEILSFFM